MWVTIDLTEDDVIIINGSLGSKIPEINAILFMSGPTDDYGYAYNSCVKMGYNAPHGDCYILGDNGHLGPWDD